MKTRKRNLIVLFVLASTAIQLSLFPVNAQTPSPQERRAAIKRLNAEALGLWAQPTRHSVRAALEKFLVVKDFYLEIGEKRLAATVMISTGRIYLHLGEYAAALKQLDRAVSLWQEIGDQSWEALTLVPLAAVYESLGEADKGLEINQRIQQLGKATENRTVEAQALGSIAEAYLDRREYAKSLEFSKQALALHREIGAGQGEMAALARIGFAHFRLKERNQSLDHMLKALLICRSFGDKGLEAYLLSIIGSVYFTLDGDKAKALEHFQQSLILHRGVGAKRSEAILLSTLQGFWQASGNSRLAIFYGKQSVNKYQELRQGIQTLNKKTQRTFLTTIDGTYRRLADILVGDGRLFEAQQVLAMLKEDEYSGYVRRDPEEIKKLASRADLRPDERAALEKYEALAGNVTEYGTRFVNLEEIKRREGAEFTQQEEYDDLRLKVEAANSAFRIFLDKELVAELGKAVKKQIDIDRALQGKLQQWGRGTVALHTVAGDDRYRVILTTPKTQTDGKTEIKIAELNRKIFDFRAALQDPLVDPRPLGKELYDILVKPVERDLAASGAKTLLWSLDGTLRYIPFAALSPDGETYLGEKYQNVVVTSTTRQSLLSEVNPEWRLLGAGVTKQSTLTEPNGTREITFSALPGVQNELFSIVNSEDAVSEEPGLMTGKRLLDEEFDLAALENGMSQRSAGTKPKYNVIHLATHFRLGGDAAKSFLLLGGNRALTLENVSDNTALNFGDVELVTLSACNTGFGTAVENNAPGLKPERSLLEENNGVEVDSLATFIELRGAKSVLATLWSVADESTQMLMSEFYGLHKQNPSITKAEAMQRAQKAMIEGRLKSSNKSSGCRSEKININGPKPADFKCDAGAPFSHPYYWSPFILIGNWR